jgi:hypothetical protein
MERLCERPGCSDRASVAYGMRPEDLFFWLDVLREHSDQAGGVLCRRHADSMVMPRGWTLDDLRDPDLHLFRPPPPVPRPRVVRSHRSRTGDATGEQLRLDATVLAAADSDAGAAGNRPEGAAAPGPWTPAFDEADDLDGLLSAQSPLLSRAFRTADRPE